MEKRLPMSQKNKILKKVAGTFDGICEHVMISLIVVQQYLASYH
jgi:hypothetical protein